MNLCFPEIKPSKSVRFHDRVRCYLLLGSGCTDPKAFLSLSFVRRSRFFAGLTLLLVTYFLWPALSLSPSLAWSETSYDSELPAGHFSVGLQFATSQKVISKDSFESEVLITNPNFFLTYHLHRRVFASLYLGTADFRTETTTINYGLLAGFSATVDYFEFQLYAVALRLHLALNYYQGEGESGPDDIAATVDYVDGKINLSVTSSWETLTIHAGPVFSLIRGNYEPEGFQAVQFEERQLVGFGGGVLFVPKQARSWQFSMELSYIDYVFGSLSVAYRF
ncbi:hypothetical protein ACFL27_23415 [candidate division CSSED10-310 bacterium]|uniref:Outer membrane protein beta-barrel domain-containing protein n=1 Tax=candidate division CSSED10-310 bacterium TaxID=2855610 RepID=A0ABV6Z3Z9_UNCC1